MLFDTHAHIDQDDFDADRDEVVARAHAAGVEHLVAVGTTLAASEKCVELASRYPGVHAAVGIQPNYVAEAQPGDWDAIVALAKWPGVVALGETGLDRYWDHAPFAAQQDFFDRHLRLSQASQLPFIVHMRDCETDILDMLRTARSRGPLRGVMHSFTGDWPLAEECLSLGLEISFAGMATFKKNQALRDVAARVPLERLLIETDSPYLSPEPMRKMRRNEPANLVHTAACLAAERRLEIRDLVAATTANARRLFCV